MKTALTMLAFMAMVFFPAVVASLSINEKTGLKRRGLISLWRVRTRV